MAIKNQTKLSLPFDEAWLVFWGGDTEKLNLHHGVASQNYAFDFIQTDSNGSFFTGKGGKNEDYFSFGRDILAPASGTVVEAVDGVRDNQPGTINNFVVFGNYVVIRHAEHEFSLLAHLRQHSLKGTAGEKVTQGQKIGECGNSGYSSDPHLHYQLQDSATFARLKDFKKIDVAKGLKVFFSNITVKRDNGETHKKTPYSPVKGDCVRYTNV